MIAHIIVVIIAGIIDQILQSVFPSGYLAVGLMFIPNMAFCCLVLTVRSWDKVNALLFTLVFGMLYDYFIAQTFLVYAITFTLLISLVRIWTKHISDSLVECLILCIVTIFAKDLIVYLYMSFMGISEMSFIEWIQVYELLTVLGNGILATGLYYLLRVKKDYLSQKDKRLRKGERIEWYKLKSRQ